MNKVNYVFYQKDIDLLLYWIYILKITFFGEKMLLLGIDLETTMADASNEGTRILEIGAVLYDWDLKQHVDIFNPLIKPYGQNFHIDSFVTRLTGINMKMLRDHGINIKVALRKLIRMAEKADFLVAHNGRLFDKKVLIKECEKFDLEFPEKFMIDTLVDIDYPPTCKYKNLTYLAGFHSILPGGHRALSDVMTMIEVLKRYDFQKTIKNTGKVKIKVITKNPEKDRRTAISMGFKWDRHRRYWHRKYSRDEWKEVKDKLTFEVIVEE
ncbi:MAG: 3'-5' exonuclease [Candidatus Muirbacterium halophilum]|nr:3'-5' exonuclease [Candidatus Muirbacterium halophilum]MCK9474972.1 3'-5' exonuclease [Candidatus Muirbacterium halophilum]